MCSAKEVLAAEEIGRWEAVGQFICYAEDGMVMVNEELEVEVKEKWTLEDGQFGLYRAIMLCSLELSVCLFVFTYDSCLVHLPFLPSMYSCALLHQLCDLLFDGLVVQALQ